MRVDRKTLFGVFIHKGGVLAGLLVLCGGLGYVSPGEETEKQINY